MAEYIIEVDEDDSEIRPIEKMEAHHKGIMHRAFSILVFNSNNELLLQKRNIEKYHSPGLWTNTCCSHPRFGEGLDEAVQRRLREEMGFNCNLKEIFSFKYKVKFEDGLTENEYDHVFIGTYDGNVFPNKDEVDGIKWVKINAVKADMEKNPNKYTYWFRCLFNEMEKHIK